MKNTIRARREELGISQIELAERARVNVTYLSSVENGKSAPTVYKAMRIAHELCCTVEALFQGEGG